MNARTIILVLCSSPWSEQREYQRRVVSSFPRWAPGKGGLVQGEEYMYTYPFFLSSTNCLIKSPFGWSFCLELTIIWFGIGPSFQTCLILFSGNTYFGQSCKKYRLIPQAHVFGGNQQHRTQLVRHQGLPKIWENLSCNCENIRFL